jgi:hypothetical protein
MARLEPIFGLGGRPDDIALYAFSGAPGALAKDAMNKLSREAKPETSIPSSKGKVRAEKKKG